MAMLCCVHCVRLLLPIVSDPDCHATYYPRCYDIDSVTIRRCTYTSGVVGRILYLRMASVEAALDSLRLRLDYLLQIRRQTHNVLVVTPRTLIPMRTN